MKSDRDTIIFKTLNSIISYLQARTTSDVNHTVIETSFGNLSSSSHSNKTQTSLKQLCSDLFKMLARYDTVLTIKQLFDIKKNLCNHYSIKNFSEFGINDDEDDDDLYSLTTVTRFESVLVDL